MHCKCGDIYTTNSLHLCESWEIVCDTFVLLCLINICNVCMYNVHVCQSFRSLWILPMHILYEFQYMKVGQVVMLIIVVVTMDARDR